MSSPSPAGSRRSRSSDDDDGPLHRQLSLSFFAAECNICRVLTIVFFNNNVLIFLTLLQANQRWRRQQRRGLGASAVSECSAEDANLLSVPNPPRRNVTHGVMRNGITLVAGLRRIRWLWQQRDKIRLGSRDSIASNVAMVMTHHRLPLLSRRHEISQGTEEPPPQQPLQSANPALPGNQPRRGRPRLPDDPAQPLRGRPLPQGVSNLALPENQPQNQPRRGRPSLPDDPAQPRPGRPRLPDAPPSDRVAAGDAMSATLWAMRC